MIRRLTDLLGRAVERRLRDVAFGVVALASVALLAAISLGFGVFAAYSRLHGLLGDVAAASVICAVFGLAAAMIALVWTARRRKAGRARRVAAPAPAPATSIASLLLALIEAGPPQDREVIAAALRLGREISPAQLLALAVAGGFIIGKKREK